MVDSSISSPLGSYLPISDPGTLALLITEAHCSPSFSIYSVGGIDDLPSANGGHAGEHDQWECHPSLATVTDSETDAWFHTEII